MEAAIVEQPVKTTAKKSEFMDNFKKAFKADSAPDAGKPPEKVETVAVESVEKSEPLVAASPTLLDSFNKQTVPKEEAKPEASVPSSKEENIANLRKSREDLEKKYSDLEKQFKETQQKIPTDYETLKQKSSKLEEDLNLVTGELKKYSLAALPEFKEKYDNRLKSSSDSIAKALATSASEVNVDKFLDLVKQPESRQRTKEIAETVSELDEYSRTKIASSVADYDRVREQREMELSNPDPSLKLSQEQAETRRKQMVEENAKLIDETIGEFEKEIPWLKEGEDSKWNEAIGHVKNEARSLWTQPTTPKQQSQAMLRAATAPLLFNLLQNAQQENARLQKKVQELSGANPRVEAGKTAEINKPTGKGSFMSDFKDRTGRA